MKKKLRYILPVGVKKGLKYSYYTLLDAKDFVTRKGEKGYPPRRLNFVGSHDFKKVGDEFLVHFKTLGKLKKDEKVLDIGCGIGRMAIPLSKYLSPDSTYRGFDIDKRGIVWCEKNITKYRPHFQFQYIDLYNKFYNANGKIHAHEFTFPYDQNRFDFVFATSVFTHLLPRDAEHYLEEIRRVTREDGRAFLTFFILDETSQALMKKDSSKAHFSHQHKDHKDCFYSHRFNPEAEIAYTKYWLETQIKKAGFKNLEIYPGTWSGQKGISYQDIVIVS
ncbi:MAG TPA: class I SAM-dependent methyltransferase [Candidatus Gracilibacteria bacterium]